MRIGIDAACWDHKRGYGRFARALLRTAVALDRKNSYVFFQDSAEQGFEFPEGVEVVSVTTRAPAIRAASAAGRRSARDLWAMNRAVARHKFDIFFFPSVYTFFPVSGRARKIVTVHDAIPELFPDLVFPSWASKFYWAAKRRLAQWQADVILTVSEYSRRCLVQKLGIPAARIRVVGESFDSSFHPLTAPAGNGFLRRFGIGPGDPYLLYVGGFSPHKNLFLLVDVFRELLADPRFGELRLVLAGDYAEDSFFSCYRELRQAVAREGLEERVVFTGFVPDETLVELLGLARCLVLPSFSEGFGLPAVEAAACGTPVVATTASPLPELLGEGGLYVAPADRRGLFEALACVLTDVELRKRMRDAALRAASSLTWENSARQLLAVFEEVRGSHHAETA